MASSEPVIPVDQQELDVAFEVVSERTGPDEPGEAWEALCRFVLEHEGQAGSWDVTLALVDDETLRGLHDRFMGLDSVTDVMTFPVDEDDLDGGDIVISVGRAAAQGPEHGLSATEEVRFLFVHGLLHLCGWDDGSSEQRDAMLRRQTDLLDLFTAM